MPKSSKRKEKSPTSVLVFCNDKGGVTPSNICCEAVTPSKYGEWKQSYFAVDCGIAQGRDTKVEPKISPRFTQLAASCLTFLITHCHINHVGGLADAERNAKNLGKRLKIFTSKGTRNLMSAALEDNCKIQQENSYRKKEAPSHDMNDVLDVMSDTNACKFEKTIQIDDNVRVTFFMNGHIIGSSMILVEILNPNSRNNINMLFTGDVKFTNSLVNVKQLPQRVRNLPLTVFMESTYGSTKREEIKKIFRDEISKFLKAYRGKSYCNIVIPAFSIGTTQDILFELKCMQESGILDKDVRIVLDGPLSQRQTEEIHSHARSFCLKEDREDFLPSGLVWMTAKNRKKSVDRKSGRTIYIASGGMLQGMSQFYVNNLIGDKNTLFFLIGYKPPETVAYKLATAKPGETIELYGQERKINAQIAWTREFSSHAMSDELIEFLKSFNNIRTLFVVHGEDETRDAFIKKVEETEELKPIVKAVRKLNYETAFRIGPFGILNEISTK